MVERDEEVPEDNGDNFNNINNNDLNNDVLRIDTQENRQENRNEPPQENGTPNHDRSRQSFGKRVIRVERHHLSVPGISNIPLTHWVILC